VYSNREAFTVTHDQKGLSGADLALYSQSEDEYKKVISLIESRPGTREAVRERPLCEGAWFNCTKFWHRAVDGVHSIENRGVAGSDFRL